MNNNYLVRFVLIIIISGIAFWYRQNHVSPTTPSPVPPPGSPGGWVDRRENFPDTVPDAPKEELPSSARPRVSHEGGLHDLEHDEKMGGHTLRKHVGRTDEQLKERLDQEHVSAASTFTDREAAESSVAAALEKNQARIKEWLQTPGHDSKLAFVYEGDPAHVIGRSLKRRADSSRPCHNVNIVLASRGDSYFVLTAYPEL